MSKYDVKAVRDKLRASMSGKFIDPDEFKPEKANSTTEPLKYRFFILPPLAKGDVIKSGTVKKSMDQFFITHADHWIDNKPYPCPRIWVDGSDCKVCQFGFDLLKSIDKKEEEKRKAVIKQWMPSTYHMVNIFFPNWKGNPEEVRGKVMFFNAPKTLFDLWSSTLMKDDCGDKDDPQAFGIFFDESAGFLFELQVLKQGRSNSYKTSKFLPNGGEPMPMIRGKDGSTSDEILAKLLFNRHNLWEKIKAPDPQKLNAVFARIVDGDDSGNDNGGFDQDDTVQTESRANRATQRRNSADDTENDVMAKPSRKGSSSSNDEDADDADEDVVSHMEDDLAAEEPLDNVSPKKTGQAKSGATAKSNAKSEPETESTDNDSSDIDDLLSQLD